MKSTNLRPTTILPGDLLVGQLILAAIALIIIYSTDTPAPTSHLSTESAVLLGLLLAVASFALILVGLKGPKRIAEPLLRQVAFVQPIIVPLNAFQLGLLAIAAGISEELLFRVALQYWAVEWLGTVAGVFTIALVFGLLHFISWAYVVTTLLIGLALGATYAYWQSVVLVVSWHFFYDLIALFSIRYFPNKLGVNPTMSQETAGQ